MTTKDIQQLIDKYLEGDTSPQEERQLAHELLRTDIPEEWQTVRLMLGELAMGEAEYDSIMARRNSRPSAILLAMRVISSIAAIYLVGLFIYLQMDSTAKTEVVCNNKVETQQPALQPTYCTEGTPREILMCYLERKQAQPNTYSQLKQMNDESK